MNLLPNYLCDFEKEIVACKHVCLACFKFSSFALFVNFDQELFVLHKRRRQNYNKNEIVYDDALRQNNVN